MTWLLAVAPIVMPIAIIFWSGLVLIVATEAVMKNWPRRD